MWTGLFEQENKQNYSSHTTLEIKEKMLGAIGNAVTAVSDKVKPGSSFYVMVWPVLNMVFLRISKINHMRMNFGKSEDGILVLHYYKQKATNSLLVYHSIVRKYISNI